MGWPFFLLWRLALLILATKKSCLRHSASQSLLRTSRFFLKGFCLHHIASYALRFYVHPTFEPQSWIFSFQYSASSWESQIQLSFPAPQITVSPNSGKTSPSQGIQEILFVLSPSCPRQYNVQSCVTLLPSEMTLFSSLVSTTCHTLPFFLTEMLALIGLQFIPCCSDNFSLLERITKVWLFHNACHTS